MNPTVDPLISLLSSTPLGSYLVYVPVVITVADLLATAIPKPSAGSWFTAPYNILQYVAFNFGKAKNATAMPPVSSDVEAAVASAIVQASKPATVAVVLPPTQKSN